MSKRKKRKSQGETSFEILKHLAINGNGYMYPLHEDSYDSYIASRTTVHRAKNDLLNDNFIEIYDEKIVDGRTRIIYTLTTKGFCLALMGLYDRFDLEEIDKMAMNNKQRLPQIFGKWGFFTENGLKKEIITRIKNTVYWFLRLRGDVWYQSLRNNEISQDAIQAIKNKYGEEEAEYFVVTDKLISGDFTAGVFGMSLEVPIGKNMTQNSGKNQKSFLETCAKDPDLRSYLSKQIHHFANMKRKEYETVRQWQQWFETII